MPKLREDDFQDKINNLPTKFDLYGLENQCRSLASAIDEVVAPISILESRIDSLDDSVEQLCKSIDALTKMIEKLPELLAKDQE